MLAGRRTNISLHLNAILSFLSANPSDLFGKQFASVIPLELCCSQ